MIGLLFRYHRRQIQAMARHIESERRLLRRATHQGQVELRQKLHSGWALAGCFAGGLLAGGYGHRFLRTLGRLPWLPLARWAGSHWVK